MYVPEIDLDQISHDEHTAREGDVRVYDDIMRHDVYHQHGLSVEEFSANLSNSTSSVHVSTQRDDGDRPPSPHDVQHSPEASHSPSTQQDIQGAPNQATNNDNDDHSTVSGNEVFDGDNVEGNDATTEITNFVDNELADGSTLDALCTDDTNILDQFDFPADFPSDLE